MCRKKNQQIKNIYQKIKKSYFCSEKKNSNIFEKILTTKNEWEKKCN